MPCFYSHRRRIGGFEGKFSGASGVGVHFHLLIVYRLKKSMNWRKILLMVHLYVGLTAGIFFAILGLTGSIIAVDEDIDHWLHPELWYVTEGRRALPENELVSTAQNRFPRGRVFFVEFPRASNLAQLMQMTDGTAVYINPYDATILGSTVGSSNSDLTLA